MHSVNATNTLPIISQSTLVINILRAQNFEGVAELAERHSALKGLEIRVDRNGKETMPCHDRLLT